MNTTPATLPPEASTVPDKDGKGVVSAAPCSPRLLLQAEVENILIHEGIIKSDAIEDPFGYDNGETELAISIVARSLNELLERKLQEAQLNNHLAAAHGELVAARKIAALSKHESYEEIGEAIEWVEAAFVWLQANENSPSTGATE